MTKLFTPNVHYSPDFERAILGACLLEKTAFGRILNLVDPEAFYYSQHRDIFSTIKGMYTNGIPVDIFTVTDQLMRVQGRLKMGNDNTDYFVARLTNAVTGTGHLEYHAYVVKQMWMDREVISLTQGGKSLEGDAKDKIFQLQQHLSTLQQQVVEHDWADMSELIVDLYRHQEEMKESGGLGTPSGFGELDRLNGGFHPGQLVVIGARPSVGKSALIGGMAVHMAQQGVKIGIVSLEMSNTEVAARLAAIDTNTDFAVLFRGLFRDEEHQHQLYQRIGNHTSTLPIFVSDKTNVNVIDIRAKVDKLKSLHGIDVLMIDYLQLIQEDKGTNRNRENEVSKMSRYCKIMAKELGIPVILLCQLNREVTKRDYAHRFPVLSDLRESGSIEQDADVVMFLHRDSMSGFTEDENGNSTEHQADLVVRKWRNGANNFVVPLEFKPTRMQFIERLPQTY